MHLSGSQSKVTPELFLGGLDVCLIETVDVVELVKGVPHARVFSSAQPERFCKDDILQVRSQRLEQSNRDDCRFRPALRAVEHDARCDALVVTALGDAGNGLTSLGGGEHFRRLEGDNWSGHGSDCAGRTGTCPETCTGIRTRLSCYRNAERTYLHPQPPPKPDLIAESVRSLCPVLMMELLPISGLTLRRALFGVLLEAGRPITVREVLDQLQDAGVTTSAWCVKPPPMVIADMLAYQVRAGRVRRTKRATYVVIASSMSRSTQRRCRRWRDLVGGI